MRSLAYAALLVALTGCSLPYQGTSFAAQPGLEAELHGKGGNEGAEGGKNDQTVEPKAEIRAENGATLMYGADKDDVITRDMLPGVGMDRTGVVFPTTAQPAAQKTSSAAMGGTAPGVDPDAKPGTNPEGLGASGRTSPSMVPGTQPTPGTSTADQGMTATTAGSAGTPTSGAMPNP